MSSQRDSDAEGHRVFLVEEGTAKLIVDAVQSLRFGAVEVTVHDGRVVQIDKRERVRLPS